MRSRFMIELTTTDVEAYLKSGGNLAFLPVGSVEMHGPHQPVGTDTLIAKAFSFMLADAANGLVLPEVAYTWCGATDGFAGSISISPQLFLSVISEIADKVYKSGFKRLVLVSCHSPNDMHLYQFCRTYFEKHLMAPIMIHPGRAISDAARKIFDTESKQRGREASMVLAAMQILGRGELYKEKEMAYDDTVPPISQSMRALRQVSTVGWFYQDAREHVCPSAGASMKLGMEFLKMQKQSFLPVLEHIEQYQAEAAKQRNTGWWR